MLNKSCRTAMFLYALALSGCLFAEEAPVTPPTSEAVLRASQSLYNVFVANQTQTKDLIASGDSTLQNVFVEQGLTVNGETTLVGPVVGGLTVKVGPGEPYQVVGGATAGAHVLWGTVASGASTFASGGAGFTSVHHGIGGAYAVLWPAFAHPPLVVVSSAGGLNTVASVNFLTAGGCTVNTFFASTGVGTPEAFSIFVMGL